MNLTENFTLAEFIKSEKAKVWKVDNTPPKDLMPVIIKTCQGLERIRAIIGNKPIQILSGYRNAAVNRLVNGSRNSQHIKGEAADIVAPFFGTPKALAARIAEHASILGVDQVILEHNRWCHVSFSFNPRNQVLTVNDNGIFQGIV